MKENPSSKENVNKGMLNVKIILARSHLGSIDSKNVAAAVVTYNGKNITDDEEVQKLYNEVKTKLANKKT